MKPIKVKDFSVNSSVSRSIARHWGEVNHTYNTNRKGVYYYSCAGHGGFVFDRKALTSVEQDTLDGLGIKPYHLTVLIATEETTGEDYVLHINYPTRRGNKRIFYSGEFENARRFEWEYYEGEEDCEWAIYSYFCNIQYGYTNCSGEGEWTTTADGEKSVKSWYRKEWEQYNGIELKPGESHAKDDYVWDQEHQDDYIIDSAGLIKDGIDIPEGKILCLARLHKNKYKKSDDDRYYLIDRETYQTRGNKGYIIGSNPSQEVLVLLQKQYA